jgi:hypothetical protein
MLVSLHKSAAHPDRRSVSTQAHHLLSALLCEAPRAAQRRWSSTSHRRGHIEPHASAPPTLRSGSSCAGTVEQQLDRKVSARVDNFVALSEWGTASVFDWPPRPIAGATHNTLRQRVPQDPAPPRVGLTTLGSTFGPTLGLPCLEVLHDNHCCRDLDVSTGLR